MVRVPLRITGFAGLVLVAFAVLWPLNALVLHVNIEDLIVFSPYYDQRPPFVFAAQLALFLTSATLIFLLPGAVAISLHHRLPTRLRILGDSPHRGADYVILSFFLSLVLCLMGFIAFRIVGLRLDLSRVQWLTVAFLAGGTLLTADIATRAPYGSRKSNRTTDRTALAAGVVALALLIFVFREYLILQNFSDDERKLSMTLRHQGRSN